MALTVNSLATLSLLNILDRTQRAQDDVYTRMSTGSKINRGSDDPAGLIALTSLDAEITSVDAALSNNERTDAIIGVADSALAEISSLITDIQSLANEAANEGGLSADEIAANQSQIDDALASIDRIISSTEFNGQKLLDGSLGVYATTNNSKISDVKVYNMKTSSSDITLTAELDTAATSAVVSGIMNAAATETTTFSVQGELGSVVIELTSGMNAGSAAALINAAKAQTGVEAASTATGLRLYSSSVGADAFVRTQLISGGAGTNYGGDEDEGTDAEVTVNGQQAAVDGNHVAFTSGGNSVAFEITSSMAVGDTSVITLKTGTGATFQLGASSSTRATIGIDGSFTHQLGNSNDGYLSELKSGGENSLLEDPAQAAEIARAAGNAVATLRGRLGGFQKFQVRTAINSLQDTKEGLETARSVINDVDYAAESAELNRQNILMQSAISLLGIANQQSSAVLALLS